MATTDERNFRSVYYEKVGFRNVEERKSLETLLKEKPMDKNKIKHFCLRFTLPSTLRNLTWNVALGILPVHQDVHKFIREQQRQEYEDLLRALNKMRIVSSNTPKHQVLLLMWLLRTENLRINSVLEEDYSFSRIAYCMLKYFEDDVSSYWATVHFYNNLKTHEYEIPKLIDAAWTIIEKEDNDLFQHLRTTRVLFNFPVEKWFESAFAGIIECSVLAK